MDRNEKLTEVATTLGLRDMDLLKVARADLPPAEAVMDLLKRFRGAFDAESSSLLSRLFLPRARMAGLGRCWFAVGDCYGGSVLLGCNG